MSYLPQNNLKETISDQAHAKHSNVKIEQSLPSGWQPKQSAKV